MKMIRIMAALALLAGTLAITRADENQVWTGSLVDASLLPDRQHAIRQRAHGNEGMRQLPV